MKCFFHSADLDGHCSGAIIKHRYPECEIIGINYGQPFPWDKIQPNEKVFMVDFTLQPFEDMERLRSVSDLVWIDHHKTELKEAEKRGFNPPGIRRLGVGACELVWEYLRHPKPVPLAVHLLAMYDVWRHEEDPRILPFQYGFRMFENTWPDNQEFWKWYLCDIDSFDQIVQDGKLILKYESEQNAKFCRAYAFPTELHVTDGKYYIGQVYRGIACNRGFTNSKVFDSVWDPESFDVMITFVRLKPPAGKWTVSLYSTKPEIDCGAIARSFGGGGHVGAAGFQSEVLPFVH